jgi:3-oxoacyl-[acyl-carrier-protein] synthase III
MTLLRAVPVGCGHYLPARVVENAEFAATLETSDEWIRTRTGIERRHFAADGEMTSDLATAAARAALADTGLTGADIDTLIVATATPDQTFPATAVRVQSDGAARAEAGEDAREGPELEGPHAVVDGQCAGEREQLARRRPRRER